MPESETEFHDLPSGPSESSGAGESVDRSISSDTGSMRDAADSLSESRESRPSEREPSEVSYQNQDLSKHDPRSQLRGERGLQKAANDLTDYREKIGAEKQFSERSADALYADYVRQGMRPDEASARALSQTQQQTPQRQTAQPVQPARDQAVEWPQNANGVNDRDQALTLVGHNGLRLNWKDPNVGPAIQQSANEAYSAMAELDQQINQAIVLGQPTDQLLAQRDQLGQQILGAQHAERILVGVQHGMTPRAAEIFADPEIFDVLQKSVHGINNNYQSELTKLYEHAVANVQNTSAAALAGIPELIGAEHDANKVAAILAGIQSQNPARANQIRQTMGKLQEIVTHRAQLQHQLMMHNYDEFQKEAHRSDETFMSWEPSMRDPTTAARVAGEVVEMLEGVGYSKDQIRTSWHSNPTFRSAPAQLIMKWASAYFKATRAMPGKRTRPTPPKVQRPGSGADIPRSGDPQRMPASFDGAKEAARFLTAQRSRR